MHAEYAAGNPLSAVVPAGPITRWGCTLYIGAVCTPSTVPTLTSVSARASHGCVRPRNDDITLLERAGRHPAYSLSTAPVKRTTEPDRQPLHRGNNPLSTTEAQFQGGEIVPITSDSAGTGSYQPSDTDQNVVEHPEPLRVGRQAVLNLLC